MERGINRDSYSNEDWDRACVKNGPVVKKKKKRRNNTRKERPAPKQTWRLLPIYTHTYISCCVTHREREKVETKKRKTFPLLLLLLVENIQKSWKRNFFQKNRKTGHFSRCFFLSFRDIFIRHLIRKKHLACFLPRIFTNWLNSRITH